jgi:hypothetical protein
VTTAKAHSVVEHGLDAYEVLAGAQLDDGAHRDVGALPPVAGVDREAPAQRAPFEHRHHDLVRAVDLPVGIRRAPVVGVAHVAAVDQPAESGDVADRERPVVGDAHRDDAVVEQALVDGDGLDREWGCFPRPPPVRRYVVDVRQHLVTGRLRGPDSDPIVLEFVGEHVEVALDLAHLGHDDRGLVWCEDAHVDLGRTTRQHLRPVRWFALAAHDDLDQAAPRAG